MNIINNNFTFLAADTLRTKIYLFYLNKNNLLPEKIIYMKSENKFLPGKFTKKINIKNKNFKDFNNKTYSLDGLEKFVNTKNFDEILERKIKIKYIQTNDVNSKNVLEQIKKLNKSVIIFSGFGGSIIGNKLLNTSNFFLHSHGGYLPSYKGSTTNYYSILEKNFIAASTIFLNEKIDKGPILDRQKFFKPKYVSEIDTIIDSAIRSVVLVKSLKKLLGKKKIKLMKNTGISKNYFIIHPILKNFAIIKK